MKRSTLGIGLVGAIVLLSVLVIFQNTYGQTDYVINTDRGSDTITVTSSEPEGPQVRSTAMFVEKPPPGNFTGRGIT